MNILLVGFMGSGKTTVGRALAEKRLMNFIDLDTTIEEEEKKTISKIFEEKKEEYFRMRESEILNRLYREKNAVIATGGGVVMQDKNRATLKNMGTVVWLDASPDTVSRNTQHQKCRPLLNREDKQKFIIRKLDERKSKYAEADIRVGVDGKTVDQIVNEIEEKIHG